LTKGFTCKGWQLLRAGSQRTRSRPGTWGTGARDLWRLALGAVGVVEIGSQVEL
jgi:hypothetical protein